VLLVAAVVLAVGTMALTLRSGTEQRGVLDIPAPASTARPERALEQSATLASKEEEREELRSANVELARRGAIQVDVVDAGGAPASEVALVCGVVAPSAPERFDARLRTRTDADGSAWIERSELSAGRLHVRAEILAATTSEVVLEPARSGERVVLQLPPTGSVRLRATDAQGRPTTAPVRFGLWARADGETKDIEPLPRWIDATDGVAVLERVGLGLELRVLAGPEGQEAQGQRITASGPAFQGDERTIDVPLGAPWPTVLARVLDDHGDPLRNELLGVELLWERPAAPGAFGSDRSAMRIRTDGDGRARFPLRGTVARGSSRRLVLTHGDDVVCSAERDLSWNAAPADEIDLGEIELRPQGGGEVAWASGTVTDLAGHPVPDATVLVSAIDAEGAPLRGPCSESEAEPDGRFVVTGAPIEGALSVRVVAPGFLRSAEEVVAPGARGLSIRLRPAARWSARLLLDADVSPEDLVVVVITPERRLRTIPASERIAIDGLEPGRFDVEVRTRAGDWLVERREGLVTSTEPPSETPAEELDLRGRLTHLRLRLAEADGTAPARVFARVESDGLPPADLWILAGRLDLLVPDAVQSITLQPRGHPSISVDVRAGLQELGLGPRGVAFEPANAPAR